jgi:hypothetical protein
MSKQCRIGSAVHKPQIRTSATRRPHRPAACRSRPPDRQLAEDPGLPDQTGATCRVVFPCTVPGWSTTTTHPPSAMVMASREDSAAAAVQACQSARRAVLRGVPRGAGNGLSPCPARFGGNLTTVGGAQEPSDLAAGYRLRGIQEAFDSPRYFVSYRRSFEVGNAPFNVDDTVTIEKPPHPLGEPSFDLAGG